MKDISVKIVGRKNFIDLKVKDNSTINDLKIKLADQISVTPKNWGIYIRGPNRLYRVDDRKLVTDKIKYYFYPNIVIR
jgi:tagatose-1,6-bisphosphate aldolase non-catalytic subunit AgaZ/GatZ